MKLTPLDLQQQVFRKTLQGYDTHQVDDFLDLIRSEWEDLIREHQSQREELMKLEHRIQGHEEKERTLQETLMTAQKLSDDMKQSAKKEAEIIISQAELQADKIIHQAHGRLTEIIDEINDLKRQRAEFEGRLRGILDSHIRLLELQNDARETSKIEEVAVLQSTT